jgi:hypothetical protein
MFRSTKNLYFDKHVIIYLILLAGHISLIYLLPYFPSQDGPAHLYHLDILSDLLDGGKIWGKHFEFNFRLVPNLGFHLLSYPLLKFFSLFTVERIFLSLYLIFIAIAFPYFLHSFGKSIFPFAYFIFPVVFNFNLMMGFYAYIISIPILFFAIALQWNVRTRSNIFNFFFINSLGLILFILHLIPFCLFIIFSFLLILTKKGKDNFLISLFRKILLLLPSLILVLVYLFGQNDIVINNFFANYSLKNYLVQRKFLLLEFFLFSIYIESFWKLLPLALILFYYFLLAYDSIKEEILKYIRYKKADEKVIVFVLFTMTLILIYFLAPFRWGSGGFFNHRLPWVILLSSFPILTISSKSIIKRLDLLIVLSVFSLFCINSVILFDQSRKIETYLAGSNVEIPKGAFAVGYKKRKDEWPVVDLFQNAISYYAISKKFVNIGHYQAWRDYFLIKFKFDYHAVPHISKVFNEPEKINWSLFPKVHYIFGYKIEEMDRKKLQSQFEVIFEEGSLSIWKRKINKLGRQLVHDFSTD